MKPLSVAIGVLIGTTLSVVVCMTLGRIRDAQRQVQIRSDIHDPIRQCLDDIVLTQERGDVTLAMQKVKLLQQRWTEYLRGAGRPPELFSDEVMRIDRTATRPAG